jgi:hypothetical protein
MGLKITAATRAARRASVILGNGRPVAFWKRGDRALPTRFAGSEFHLVGGGEGFGGGLDAGDAVDPVTAELAAVVDDEQDQVPVLGAAQGVRLDAALSPSPVLGTVVDVDLEPVRSGVAEELKRDAASP